MKINTNTLIKFIFSTSSKNAGRALYEPSERKKYESRGREAHPDFYPDRAPK